MDERCYATYVHTVRNVAHLCCTLYERQLTGAVNIFHSLVRLYIGFPTELKDDRRL